MSDPPPAPTVGRALPALGSPALHALGLLDELQAQVTQCAEALGEHVHRLRVRRALYDGAWVVGVHIGGRAGGGLAYSRLDFELRADGRKGSVCVLRRLTVRDRDAPSVSFEASSDSEGRRRMAGFVEAGFLEFARSFFESA